MCGTLTSTYLFVGRPASSHKDDVEASEASDRDEEQACDTHYSEPESTGGGVKDLSILNSTFNRSRPMESSDGHDTMTAGVCGESKARMYSLPGPVYADSCVYIVILIQRFDWVGLDPSFLRKLREIFPRHSGEKKECLI